MLSDIRPSTVSRCRIAAVVMIFSSLLILFFLPFSIFNIDSLVDYCSSLVPESIKADPDAGFFDGLFVGIFSALVASGILVQFVCIRILSCLSWVGVIILLIQHLSKKAYGERYWLAQLLFAVSGLLLSLPLSRLLILAYGFPWFVLWQLILLSLVGPILLLIGSIQRKSSFRSSASAFIGSALYCLFWAVLTVLCLFIRSSRTIWALFVHFLLLSAAFLLSEFVYCDFRHEKTP